MFKIGEKIYFHNEHGCQEGYINKVNRNTYNILVNDKTRPEGYQLWRVTEFFLGKTPEDAKLKWDDYKRRLEEYKQLLKLKRESNEFYCGQEIIVNSLHGPPYTATVLENNRISLNVNTADDKLMKVDKAICEPLLQSNFSY